MVRQRCHLCTLALSVAQRGNEWQIFQCFTSEQNDPDLIRVIWHVYAQGFATFLEYRGWQHTDPEFEPQKYFMNGAFQYAMNYDATLALTHPIVNDAVTTDEINSYFTGITYEKGASLIRMMEHFLGWETLRKGLVLYLNDMWATQIT